MNTVHTRMRAALDWVAWGWLTMVAVAIILIVAAAIGWIVFVSGRWALRHWDWLTVAILSVMAFTWWCSFQIRKTERPPWIKAPHSDDQNLSGEQR